MKHRACCPGLGPAGHRIRDGRLAWRARLAAEKLRQAIVGEGAGGVEQRRCDLIDLIFEAIALESESDPLRPTGLDYYPLVTPGERFPINDPKYPPRVSPRPESDAQFFQALLEGIAGVERLAYRRLQEIGASALASLRTVGGGAHNQAWTAIRRRMIKVPFMAALNEDAAAGTAVLAWRGIGVEIGR